MAHPQGVDHVSGHHEPVTAVGVRGIGPPPVPVVGDAALHIPVVGQRRV
ncbi:MAG TPA: hypothetical protein VHN16_02965 [Streptosporangiaceae bacterium]|nr:hypothetical protein [Streptosporangiaceae bacterium]